MKKKKSLGNLRYRNLKEELAKYGYELTLKKTMAAYGAVVLSTLVCGMLYKLELPYIAAIVVLMLLVLPGIVLQSRKGIYHTTMFSLVNTYMDQFLYSFQKNGTVLNALTETASIFDEGEFREVLEGAIEYIQYETKSDDPEQEALNQVGAFFECDKVNAIHSFVLGAQRRGGDVVGSIGLLSKNRAMWADRIINLQKEFQVVKRNILVALVATVLICILPLYLLGGQ